jgi:hypothetical protein
MAFDEPSLVVENGRCGGLTAQVSANSHAIMTP